MAVAPLRPAFGQSVPPPVLVALVSDVSGDVSTRSTPGGPSGKAQRFDALVDGATLDVGAQGRAVVVLAAGPRFALGPGARATVSASALVASSGDVTPLSALPALPKIAPLDESRPKGPAGGVRIRGTVMTGLRPADTVILTEPLTLRFDVVAGAGRYAAVIDDALGRRVFAAESSTADVAVPTGVLVPGASYYWTVQALGAVGGDARGISRFRTLSADDVQTRETLRRAVEADGGADALALLAETDRRSGLFREALDGFRAALARQPGDAALLDAIRWLEARLDVGRH